MGTASKICAGWCFLLRLFSLFEISKLIYNCNTFIGIFFNSFRVRIHISIFLNVLAAPAFSFETRLIKIFVAAGREPVSYMILIQVFFLCAIHVQSIYKIYVCAANALGTYMCRVYRVYVLDVAKHAFYCELRLTT